MRADDLARLITHVDAGPAVVLGSSGGAVTVLALTQAHPELVHTVIAHEPPLDVLVEDREELRAKTDDMIATYLSGDTVGAWKKFMAIANIGMPGEMIEQIFGGDKEPQDVADERYQSEHMLRPTTQWLPDFAVLGSVPCRIVVGIGEQSGDELCERTSTALAEELVIKPTMFPGGHIGFAEDPAAFAPALRAVLDQN